LWPSEQTISEEAMNQQASKSRRVRRRVLWASLAVVLLAAGIILGISGYAASSLTRFERVPIGSDPANFGLEYADVSFPSRDGLTLRGWWLEGGYDSPVIVVVHGSEGNRAYPADRMLGIVRDLVSHGYNVLTFDMRGHGESDGEHISAGLYEKNDLLGATDYIRGRGIENRIGILGFSMGAAVCLITAPESEEIDAVVADAAYADVVSIIESEFAERSDLPGFFIPIILSMTRTIYDVDFAAIKPEEAVKETSVPVFIIHGEQDAMIPVEHAYRLKEASQNPDSKLWIVPEAQHANSYLVRPAEYKEQVTSFFDEALG
jgi:dipeptidyl aminopeptidase/acylaminoacyl peptidase